MSFETALSGLQAADAQLKVAGNNIANTSTTGFKMSRAQFSDVYAASVLGTGGNAIGSGVKLDSVLQQFSQGTITFTNNALDLAINGEGFFCLDKGGEKLYSRSGAFSINSQGYIVNANGCNLQGYVPDFAKDSTGATMKPEIENLKIENKGIAPVATSEIKTSLNLNAAAAPTTVPFKTGFKAGDPPAVNSYLSATSTPIYDSKGGAHTLTMYFTKAPDPSSATGGVKPNVWQMFLGIDGNDVTPQPTSGKPTPFTLVFDSNGILIPNNPSVPISFNKAANASMAKTTLVDEGKFPIMAAGDLVINGKSINPPQISNDTISTVDRASSAEAIKNKLTSELAGPPADYLFNITPASYNFGKFTLNSGTGLASGELIIEGVDISTLGASLDTGTKIADAITSSTALCGSPPAGKGLSASYTNNKLVITASDGRNISIKSTAATGNVAFENYAISTSSSKVARGTVTVTYNKPPATLSIAGDNPGNYGFTAGTYYADYDIDTSDSISITYPAAPIPPAKPDTTPTNITIDFSSSTQFGAPFATQLLQQNGSTTGRLAGLDVDSSGVLFARYTNGQSEKISQIALARFPNSQGLQPQGNTNWSETFTSGERVVDKPNSSNLGLIQSGSLEESNTDLTKELVNLIVAQRNFQANAQTIKTADTVTQTIINLR